MIITICGTKLHWESLGHGIPMVCLHGYGVDHRAIKSAMEPVCGNEDGFRRIYLDLPGMGQSQTQNLILSSDDMLEVVCQFIDAVVGPGPFVLAGYSYGGYLARGVVYQMPGRVRGLLLICPVVGFRRKGRTLPAFRLCEQDPALFQQLSSEEFRQMDGVVTVQTRAVWEGYRTHILPALDLSDSRLMARIRDSEFSFPVDRCGRPHEMPALILAGRYDVSVGFEDASRLIVNFSDADFVVLARAGHLLHLEQPDLFAFHAAAWMNRVRMGIAVART